MNEEFLGIGSNVSPLLPDYTPQKDTKAFDGFFRYLIATVLLSLAMGIVIGYCWK